MLLVRILLTVGCVLLLLTPASGWAQAPAGPLVTDRPDQTESSTLVRPGALQVELGWVYSGDSEGTTRVRTHTFPVALARFGVSHRVEGRVGFSGWVRNDVDPAASSAQESGLADLDVGVKVKLVEGGVGPDVALIGVLTLPTGQRGFGGERVLPAVSAAFAHELHERVSLGYNVGVAWSAESEGTGPTDALADLLYSLVFGFALTERLGVFAESFGSLALDGDGDPQHAVDWGMTVLIRSNVQLDVSGGAALNDAAEEWFVGAGLSVRFPR